MRHHLHKHFTRAAAHHSQMADEHHGLHKLHTEHAAHHAGEGDHIKAAHHREVAAHHKRLAKLHGEHSEHCEAMGKALEPDSRGNLSDVDQMSPVSPAGKALSDAAFIKALIGEFGE
jgi:hypothetical protein